jgi:predicted RNA-binding protein associated with RNAse of E/G family
MGWKPGDEIVLREMWLGRVWTAMPARVVEDSPGQRIDFIPPGTLIKYAVDEGGNELRLYTDHWRLVDHVTRRAVLGFSWPDRRHAILALWDEGWNFTGWYVNVETPLAKTERTLDYVDHCIDVLVSPDRSMWSWKDEEELEEAVRRGIFTADEAAAFRAEGEQAVGRLLRREPPFDREWDGWRPDPAWSTPTLPDGWDRVGG